EVVAGHGAAHLYRVVFGRGAANLDTHLLGGSFGVGEQLSGQLPADGGDGRRELFLGGFDAGCAAGQEQHGVVGGQAPIGVEPFEGDPDCVAQHRVEHGGGSDRVGGEHAEHGGEGWG